MIDNMGEIEESHIIEDADGEPEDETEEEPEEIIEEEELKGFVEEDDYDKVIDYDNEDFDV